ncbi:DUF6417 family protein [Streptomyces sp. NPDC002306]
MDDYDHLDLDAIIAASAERTSECLALLMREEAHDLLALLAVVAQEDATVSPEADRLAREIAVRIPSEN